MVCWVVVGYCNLDRLMVVCCWWVAGMGVGVGNPSVVGWRLLEYRIVVVADVGVGILA
jgi:hypothetical protein